MKIIHCADLHLESKIDGVSSEKSKIRREEILHTFERMCDFACKNGVSAVIIAGDMFDTGKVTIKTQARVLSAISKCENVDFLYLSGNHDEDNFIASCEKLPKNLKVFSDKWTAFVYDNVVIAGVNVNKFNSGVVYDNLMLEENKFNVVVMHGQVVQYASTELEAVSIPLLKNKNIDYLALGHYHSFSEGEIDERGKYLYSGCLDGRGFDETGVKGFILLEIDGKDAEYQFVNFSSRELFEYNYNISNDADWISAKNNIIEQLNKKYKQSDLIRSADFEVDKDGLDKRLNEHFFFAKVYDKTELKINMSDYSFDKSIKGEFVRAVWQSDLTEQEKSDVIMCGINALKGEEI